MQRIAEKLKTALGVAVANRTATTVVNGTGRAVAEGSEVIGVCVVGAMAADTDCVFTLEECDAVGGTYAAIPGATCTVLGAQTSNIQLISARPSKKFVRASVDPGGTGVGNGVLTGMHLLIAERGEPAASDPENVIA